MIIQGEKSFSTGYVKYCPICKKELVGKENFCYDCGIPVCVQCGKKMNYEGTCTNCNHIELSKFGLYLLKKGVYKGDEELFEVRSEYIKNNFVEAAKLPFIVCLFIFIFASIGILIFTSVDIFIETFRIFINIYFFLFMFFYVFEFIRLWELKQKRIKRSKIRFFKDRFVYEIGNYDYITNNMSSSSYEDLVFVSPYENIMKISYERGIYGRLFNEGTIMIFVKQNNEVFSKNMIKITDVKNFRKTFNTVVNFIEKKKCMK